MLLVVARRGLVGDQRVAARRAGAMHELVDEVLAHDRLAAEARARLQQEFVEGRHALLLVHGVDRQPEACAPCWQQPFPVAEVRRQQHDRLPGGDGRIDDVGVLEGHALRERFGARARSPRSLPPRHPRCCGRTAAGYARARSPAGRGTRARCRSRPDRGATRSTWNARSGAASPTHRGSAAACASAFSAGSAMERTAAGRPGKRPSPTGAARGSPRRARSAVPSVPPTSRNILTASALRPADRYAIAEVKLGLVRTREATSCDPLLHHGDARVELAGADVREADIRRERRRRSPPSRPWHLRQLLLVVDHLLRRRVAQLLLGLRFRRPSRARRKRTPRRRCVSPRPEAPPPWRAAPSPCRSRCRQAFRWHAAGAGRRVRSGRETRFRSTRRMASAQYSLLG